MSNVNITYETLYEILRNEKNREDIQELSPTFFTDVISYLSKNQKNLDDAIESNFSEDDKEDIFRQIKNIKNLIKEIYDRRESKIMNLALNFARTKSESIEIEALLPQEREFYTMCVETFQVFRKKNLEKVLRGVLPTQITTDTQVQAKEIPSEEVKEEQVDEDLASEEEPIDKEKKEELEEGSEKEEIQEETEEIKQEKVQEKSEIENTDKSTEQQQDSGDSFVNRFKTEEAKEDSQSTEAQSTEAQSTEAQVVENQNLVSDDANLIKIRFKEAVPKFLGKELEVYGPFEVGDESQLPQDLANILLKKDKAEQV